jgi:hypothetical protein
MKTIPTGYAIGQKKKPRKMAALSAVDESTDREKAGTGGVFDQLSAGFAGCDGPAFATSFWFCEIKRERLHCQHVVVPAKLFEPQYRQRIR